MNLLHTLRAFFARWQEPIVWLPGAFVLLIGAYYLLPQIDPRAGIDGFGSLWASGVTAFNVLLAGFLAWLLRTTYFRELTDTDERELLDHACGIERADYEDDRARGHAWPPRIGSGPQSWPALAFLIGDRIVWIGTFALIFTALQG
ncbi:MAG: hypothetical protein ACK51F_10655 [Rhodospirillales bacterium]